MNKYQRAKKRIARDKILKAEKHEKLYAQYDNFNNAIKMQNFCNSVPKCKKGVIWKGTVQNYDNHAITETYEAYSSLHDGKMPRIIIQNKMTLNERGKERIIVPVEIHDRMVQRVLCDNALLPVISKKLIYENGASLKDKGVEFSRDILNRYLKEAVKKYGTDFYALVFDFHDYFGSIPHMTCLNVLSTNFIDKYIKGLTMAIIKSYEKHEIERLDDIDLKDKQMQKLKNNELAGICLGSQVSQIMALVVPNELDHYIKDECGIHMYIRHMDDGVMLSDNKETLHKICKQMKEICTKLGLQFNEKKTHIVKVSKGFKFLKMKYRVTESGKIVRTLTRPGIVRMRRKLKRFRRLVDEGKMLLDDVYNSVQSWFSHAEAAMSYHARKNMMKLYNLLFGGYRISKSWRHTCESNQSAPLAA